MNRKKYFTVVDTTLRDGAQMPGVRLHRDDKIGIVDALQKAGVNNIEIGYPACSESDSEDIRAMNSMFPSLHFSVWARAREHDIIQAARTGVSSIHISFPTSKRHHTIQSTSPQKTLHLLEELITFAQLLFNRVTVGAQDATRGDESFLIAFAQQAHKAGAARLRIADTVGVATPENVSRLIYTLQEQVPDMPYEFHAHNDCGLATANTLAAIQAGADAVSCTVCGVGERAGNASLEQIAASSHLLLEQKTSINLTKLPYLCEKVSAIFNVLVSPHTPVIGANAFSHESGIHCHGMLKDKQAYQPCEASTFGRTEQYVPGTHAGSSTIQAYFLSQGIAISRAQAAVLLLEVKKKEIGFYTKEHQVF